MGELVAQLSCGDVVDEWDPPQTETRRPDIHMSKCKGCGGKWRRVVEIRPKKDPAEELGR